MSAIVHANLEALEQLIKDLKRIGEDVRASQLRIAIEEIRSLRAEYMKP